MKYLRPYTEIYEIPESNNHNKVLQFLELIGRTCYKSEDKITDESAKDYLIKIRNRKHWAMLEHYIFTFSVQPHVYDGMKELLIKAKNMTNGGNTDDKLQYIRMTEWNDAPNSTYQWLISFSPTALNYLIESDLIMSSTYKELSDPDSPEHSALLLYAAMLKRYPEVIIDAFTDASDDCNFPKELSAIFDESDKSVTLLGKREISLLPFELRCIHDWMTVKFVCDRGVSHEIVRHRPASYAQESTRYCNYSKDKNDNQISVIVPSFFDTGSFDKSNSNVFEAWRESCLMAERKYMELISYGASPQQARSVLPNSLKTEIVMTARLGEWRHFFAMRADAPAHPQMRELAVPLLRSLHNSDPEMWDDLIHYAEDWSPIENGYGEPPLTVSLGV